MLLRQEISKKWSHFGKLPFQIDEMLDRIEVAVKPYPKAMLFDLYDRGYREPFQILVACMISIRTLDEVSLQVALQLFSKAKTPRDLANLTVDELDGILSPSEGRTSFDYRL